MSVILEGDEVRSQEAPSHLLSSRQNPEHVGRGEGDVQKESDGGLGDRLPQQLRQQHELVVVDPDQVAGTHPRRHGIAETMIGVDVGVPPFRVELEARGELVKERPERAVRVAVIEALHERPRQLHRDVAVLPLPSGEQLLLRGGWTFGDVAGPADPKAAGSAEHRLQRGG
jgi:hypothetical protein